MSPRPRFGEEAENPDSPPVANEPSPLADLLDIVTRRQGWRARLEGAEIFGHWEEIAGEQLARHAEPVRLHRGVLIVRAESPAWATQVRFLAGAVAQRANAVLGEGTVTDVRVVSGRLQGTSRDPK